jgi:signal transduction histidine kinase
MKEFSHPDVKEKVAIDIAHAIETTVTVARNEWKYVADIAKDFDPEMPSVPALPGEFNQVILNLIVNAAHAIHDVVKINGGRGVITISTRRENGFCVVRVKDTGSGIPEWARPRIFDPFFTTKEVGRGTGQGLAITRSVIVEKHGGTVEFETETNVGTTFIVKIPLG